MHCKKKYDVTHETKTDRGALSSLEHSCMGMFTFWTLEAFMMWPISLEVCVRVSARVRTQLQAVSWSSSATECEREVGGGVVSGRGFHPQHARLGDGTAVTS